MDAWREELNAIIGARHEGRIAHVLDRLRALDARHPNIADVAYELAWTLEENDQLADARPHYEKAIALGLPPNLHSGALIGLGSTLRELGDPERAADVLRGGQLQFPDNPEFAVFLALALHDLGQHAEAMKLLLTTIADTADDPGLTAYQRTIRHEASKLAAAEP